MQFRKLLHYNEKMRKTYLSGISMNKNNFIDEPRFQYATTMPAFPNRYAVSLASFCQYIIIRVRQAKL